MKQSKISRRSFLLGLGAVSTAALLAACGEAASSAPASSAASSETPASSASGAAKPSWTASPPSA